MNSAVTGKLKAWRNKPGKRPPEGAGKGIMRTKSVRTNTKNEPVVGRNNHQRTRSCEGAELTPGLWICQTKEVGTKILLDMGG